MNIKENIEKLFNLNLSNYKISKETGIAQTTLGRFTRKESDLGNMTLDNALKLNNYYIKLKGEIRMMKIYETINYNFLADRQEGKYVTIYNNLDEITDQFGNIENFMEKFRKVAINEDYFPIITFYDNSSTYAKVFTKLDDREEIMYEANEFFSIDNSVDIEEWIKE